MVYVVVSTSTSGAQLQQNCSTRPGVRVCCVEGRLSSPSVQARAAFRRTYRPWINLEDLFSSVSVCGSRRASGFGLSQCLGGLEMQL